MNFVVFLFALCLIFCQLLPNLWSGHHAHHKVVILDIGGLARLVVFQDFPRKNNFEWISGERFLRLDEGLEFPNLATIPKRSNQVLVSQLRLILLVMSIITQSTVSVSSTWMSNFWPFRVFTRTFIFYFVSNMNKNKVVSKANQQSPQYNKLTPRLPQIFYKLLVPKQQFVFHAPTKTGCNKSKTVMAGRTTRGTSREQRTSEFDIFFKKYPLGLFQNSWDLSHFWYRRKNAHTHARSVELLGYLTKQCPYLAYP